MKVRQFIQAELLFVLATGIFLLPRPCFAQNANLGSESGLDKAMQQNEVKDRKGEFVRTVKVDKREEAAYQAFLGAQTGEIAKRIELGEQFATLYPSSVYLPGVYGILTSSYFTIGDTDRMLFAGNRAIQLDPTNVDAMSLLAMAVPRRVKATTPEGVQQLQTAEAYARRAIEIIPTIAKPVKVDDAAFEKAKNDKLALAHSGLGLIAMNHQKYDEAKTELSQAVQLASVPDPVDYYLLGNADAHGGYYKDAIEAYTKCADSGPLVADCRARAESARRDAETKISR